jgi:hypothetical protein
MFRYLSWKWTQKIVEFPHNDSIVFVQIIAGCNDKHAIYTPEY